MGQSPEEGPLNPEEKPALRIVARRTPAGPKRWPSWVFAAIALAVGLAATAYFVNRGEKPESAAETGIQTPVGDMLLVPAGPFRFGPNAGSIHLPAFYIDKTEVTNAPYGRFCKETGRPLPAQFSSDQPGHPVVNVSPVDAAAFAAWAGKRLPTGLEWEKAARGEGGRAFPWGWELDPSRAAIGLGQPVAANAFPDGASPYGALQMVGNVWEIVSDEARPTSPALAYFQKRMAAPPADDEPWLSIRGGAFDFPQMNPQLTWVSTSIPARWTTYNIGFRCAKDAPR